MLMVSLENMQNVHVAHDRPVTAFIQHYFHGKHLDTLARRMLSLRIFLLDALLT